MPLYPDDSNRMAKVGRCVKGWIPFEVPKGDKPKYIAYDPSTSSALEWTVR
ncbi:hypothetical protein [Herbidospora cretacea]|uniref:hypothetical protein n=1 Tax=Herbidospora cretacea TaxID=28444 RepID=UPI000AA0390F|nr:hypothetical protein [Herbidospora cretacea]